MNIAAAMASMNVDDLDQTAKHALLILTNRADLEGETTVSIGRLAKDLSVHYGTAWRALQRLETTGYIAAQPVGKHPGKPRTWRLRSRVGARMTSRASANDVARQREKGRAPARDKGSFKEKRERERAASSRREAATGGAVENGHVAATRHADTCLCGGSGWVAGDDDAVTRCPYRPQVAR